MRRCFFGFEAIEREAKQADENSLLSWRKSLVKPRSQKRSVSKAPKQHSALLAESASTRFASVIRQTKQLQAAGTGTEFYDVCTAGRVGTSLRNPGRDVNHLHVWGYVSSIRISAPKPAMKRFYIIDYIDEEGEQNVKHALLEPEEAKELVEEMARNGIQGTVCDISPQPAAPPVMSEHEEVPRLAANSQRP